MTLSDLNFAWPVLLGLLIACTTVAWFFWTKLKYARADTILIQRKSRMLTIAERNLFDCLVDALSEKYFVFAKVGIKDIVEASSSATPFDVKYINKELNGSYFDFVLCKQSDMSIFAVVEVEHSERSRHKRKNSRKLKQRDKLINRVCNSANLKLFYFDVRQDYKSMDIARLITGTSKRESVPQDRSSPTHQSQLTIDNSSHSVAGHVRNCPKCRSEVVTKVAVKGSNIGEKFLMCRKYPYCDYRISMKDLESMRKLEQEEGRKSKSEGFKNWSAG